MESFPFFISHFRVRVHFALVIRVPVLWYQSAMKVDLEIGTIGPELTGCHWVLRMAMRMVIFASSSKQERSRVRRAVASRERLLWSILVSGLV